MDTLPITPMTNKEADQRIILVIDDSPENTIIIQKFIETALPYQIVTAANGAEALELLNQLAQVGKLPALILSDVLMPVMSGIQFAQALQTRPEYARIPLMLLSAYATDLPRSTGAARLLVKPVRKAQLVAEVQAVLAFAEDKGECTCEE